MSSNSFVIIFTPGTIVKPGHREPEVAPKASVIQSQFLPEMVKLTALGDIEMCLPMLL